MPEVNDFLNGFNVSLQKIYDDFRLENINIEHQSIIRYNIYKYPMTLDFTYIGSSQIGEDEMKKFAYNFLSNVSGKRIIRTASNRPYSCIFFHENPVVQYSEDYKKVKIIGEGYAHRVKESDV